MPFYYYVPKCENMTCFTKFVKIAEIIKSKIIYKFY